ncbi:TPA: hypothetical protein MI602_23755 [Klebsiella pneumoniae]|nr:hypothetical protein [Klebsiella pneumoniae]
MPYSPAKLLPRSATLCVGRDCAHFRHILFFYFFSFFRPRGGGGPGTVKVRILKGMLSYAGSFAACSTCRRSESGKCPSPVFPHLWHTVDINPV